MSEEIGALPAINGYQLLEKWETSGSCRWSYAEKDGQQWFIKQFLAPKYKRIEDGVSPQKVEKSRQRCEAFRKMQSQLYAQIADANTGNIIAVDNFFSFESMFYAVTKRVDISSVSIADVSRMQHEQKMILLKVLTHSLDSLHKHSVVHADLKPDNILIKRTRTGYTLKLIDFDASFLENQPKRGEQICFDPTFVAPETIVAYNDESVSLNRKIDIFALGLLFHLYYTGQLPAISKEYNSVCSAVLDGASLMISPAIPGWLVKLIRDMLILDPSKRPDSEHIFQALLKQSYPLMEPPISAPAHKGFYTPMRPSVS